MRTSASCTEHRTAVSMMDHDESHARHHRGRVGYWWSEKKSRKFNVSEFTELCRSAGLELIKINLEQPLDDQGPFDAILHKLSDIVVKAAQGNETCKNQCKNIEDYFKRHPDLIIIDPLSNVEKLLDRFRQYKSIVESELGKKDWVFTPNFVELTTIKTDENLRKLKEAGVNFPFVCKPSVAHGSSYAHQMALIFNEEGLKDINPPCVAQSFINHNAVLYKLFIIGKKYFVIERPSLKNFYACDQETIFFDSHDISKPHSASALTERDDSDPEPTRRPEKRFLDTIVQVMQRQLGLSLFGIDVIVENATGRFAIIDMNAFPGYDGVDNCLELLRDLVIDHLNEKSTRSCNVTSNNLENLSVKVSDSPATEPGHFAVPFDSVDVIGKPQCLCCPISLRGEVCRNMCCIKSISKLSNSLIASAEERDFKIPAIPPTTTEELLAADNSQDDSGIDTSDSCDEKKNKPMPLRAIKRLHSRTHAANIIAVSAKGGDTS